MNGSVTVLHFSPTGSVKKIALQFASGLGLEVVEHDLSLYPPRPISVAEESIAVVAIPVFGGRLPLAAIAALENVTANGQKAVALVVYGNRHYDDALLELTDLLKKQNFEVIAGGAFVARHSLPGELAKGRPNEKDMAEIDSFASNVKEKLESGAEQSDIVVPGNHPYKVLNLNKIPIEVTDACILCGLCAKKCPVGAIPADQPNTTDIEKCFGCMRCVNICPTKARKLPEAVVERLSTYLSQYSEPKENEVYL